MGADAQLAVNAERAVPIVVASELAGSQAVDEERPQAGAVRKLSTDARHGVVVGVGDSGEVLGLHVQETDVVTSGFAAETSSGPDRHHDAPGPMPMRRLKNNSTDRGAPIWK